MHFHLLDDRDSLPTGQLRDVTNLLRAIDPAEGVMTRARLADLTRTSVWVFGKMFVGRDSQIIALGVLVPKSAFGTIRLEKIVVADGSRRQGIGIQLMHCLIDVGKTRGFRNIEAGLVEEGSPMERLFRRFHFVRNSGHYDLSLE